MTNKIERVDPIFGSDDMESRSVGPGSNISIGISIDLANSFSLRADAATTEKSSRRRFISRKRTHTRGVVVAILIKWTGVFFVAFAAAELTNYFSETRGVANPLKSGPFPVYSYGWYVSQAAAALVGALAGCVSAYFSPSGTWRAPIILAAIYLGLGLVSSPASKGALLTAYWTLIGPISIAVGALVFRGLERTNGA